MKICLIRHGVTAGNAEHRYVGSTDEELTEEGIHKLCGMRGQYPSPDLVFASPMRRCIQTAEILFPGRKPELSADLRECAFGDFEYKNYQELQGDDRYQAWIDSGGVIAFPGGESREAFADRCCTAFEACSRNALDCRADVAAFVVHGGTIMALLDRYAVPHRDYFDWQVSNAHGYICELIFADSEVASAEGVAMGLSLRVISELPCLSDGENADGSREEQRTE